MNDPVHLAAGPCVLRPFREEDVLALARHANDRQVSGNLRDRFPYPYTEQDARDWVAIAGRQEPVEALAIVLGGSLVGGIGRERRSDIHRFGAEVGYWLGREHWGRGLATAALRAFCDWTFATTDLERLYAGVMEHNPASARVLEKSGFVREGVARRAVHKDGRFLDEWIYARLRDPGVEARA